METRNVDDAFKKFDETTSETLPIRKSLINKLNDIVKNYEMDLNNCSPSDRESFMAVINGLGGLLNDQEKSAIANVKLHLQQKSDEQSSESSDMVIDLLRSLAGRKKTMAIDDTPSDIPSGINNDIEKICTDESIAITEGELEEIPSAIGGSND